MSSEYTREFVMKFLPAQFLKCTYQCKPRGEECGQGVIWQILKFFDQIPISIYFFGSFYIYYIPHNYVIPQAMPTLTVFSLLRLAIDSGIIWHTKQDNETNRRKQKEHLTSEIYEMLRNFNPFQSSSVLPIRGICGVI